MRAKGVRRVAELAPGEEFVDGDLRVLGVPAAHSGHRFGPRSTAGPQARAMGTSWRRAAPGSTRPATPTCSTTWPRSVRSTSRCCRCWGWGPTLGPGHLDPARAAVAVERLRPRVVVPVHWGSFAVAGLTAVPGGPGARMRRLLVHPPRVFAATVAAGTSGAQVAVTEPGAAVLLPVPM